MATIVRVTKDSVDREKCIGCGACARSCPVKLYDIVDGKSVPARPDDCVGCGVCLDECLEDAITLAIVG